MEVEELPECTECRYHEPPYFICRACKVIFHENKANYFEKREEGKV